MVHSDGGGNESSDDGGGGGGEPDFVIEPGQNLDLTDPDDPVVEEDGEVVREPEPSGGDSESDRGFEPEDNDSGGSSGDSDTGDDSTVVTVVGDPGSKEGLTTVGRGDSIEESERDAATNPNFDADEGTDIDDLEESLGTDQPGINPDDSASDSTSVVVAENQQGEQVTISQAQTQTGAKVQAAADQSFDAAQGTDIDLFESSFDQGLGDGTTLDDVDQTDRLPEQTNGRPDNVFEENIEDAQIIQAQLTDNQREFAQARNPNTPIVENVGDIVRTIGREGQDVIEGNNPRQSFRDIENSFLIEGQGIISQGQQFGDRVGSDLKQGDVEIRSAGQPVENVGTVLDFAGADTVGNQLQDTGEKIDRSLVSGVASGGTAAGGIAVQTPGASSKLLRGSLQDLGFDQFDGKDELNPVEAGKGGVRLTADQAKDDPVKFIFSEAGEEAIETVGGFAVGGSIGAAAAAAPTPTPQVSVTSSVKNAASSAKQAVTDPNAAGSLAGGFLPDETSPGNNPTPGNDPRPGKGNTVRLQDVDTTGIDLDPTSNTETSTQAQETDTTGTDFDSNIDVESTSESIVESDSQGLPETVSQPENIAESQPESDTISVPEAVSEGRPEAEPETTPETTPEAIPDTFVEAIPETRTETVPETVVQQQTQPEPSITPDDQADERQKQRQKDDDDDNSLVGDFAASLDALVFGITGSNQNIQNPLKTRPIQKDVEETLEGVEKELKKGF